MCKKYKIARDKEESDSGGHYLWWCCWETFGGGMETLKGLALLG